MATPFDAQSGTLQQRIPTAHAAQGLFGYELGHARHMDVRLAPGDHHDLSQTFDVSVEAWFLRMRIRIEAPPIADAAWKFEALLNGAVQYTRDILTAGRVLELHDVTLRLNGAPASSLVTLRLRLL